MTDTRSRPLPYSPADERPQPREEQTRRTIDQTLRSIQQTTLADYGHPVRPVHAKSHAIVQGELTVTADLPPELAQGMFARAGTSPVVMRVSTNPGDVLDDSVSAPRGLALKIIGVDGERLPGHDAATQDWVLVNGPAFSAPDSAAFAKNLKLLAATTDTGQEWKKAFSAALRGAETAVEAVGGESPTLITLGGQASTHPLGESYYTQTPFRYGDHVAKLSLAPASAELKALTDQPVATRGRPNALREAAIDFFRSQDAEWELRVQLRTNPDTMPIEDASVVWPEDESPYRSVGRVIVRPQPAWSEERARQVDDGLSFSPWHGLAAHEPLGSVNRARRGVYDDAAAFRARHTGCPMAEPTDSLDLSDAPARAYGTAQGREGRRPGTPDAREGHWTQPMKPTARRLLAGAAGGLAAGLVLSALMARADVKDGTSELVKLQRRTAAKVRGGEADEQAGSGAGEALMAHGGHLALSALAGAAYGAATRNGSPVRDGLLFGAVFWTLAYGVTGPALGVTPAPWRDTAGSLAQHGALHALFGVLTGFTTDGIERRL